MASILRSRRSIRPITTIVRPSIIQGQGQRLYGQSSYGGDGEVKSEDGRNNPTRDLEHPGPPPPDVGQGSQRPKSSQPSPKAASREVEEDISIKPTNKAGPTITDGRQSANVDDDGNTKPDVPEDVKRHNEEIDQRHDKPYNRIKDQGKVGKGFWKLDGGGAGD
ncbi:hypothetical protein BJX63DRAFT_306644 [Aspergillus granulosus]|uniref:Uncharacterized protein n=1 Tax=Aspergillus granulosus TaxID=176169 RepID=A0ABR4H797_9EURO